MVFKDGQTHTKSKSAKNRLRFSSFNFFLFDKKVLPLAHLKLLTVDNQLNLKLESTLHSRINTRLVNKALTDWLARSLCFESGRGTQNFHGVCAFMCVETVPVW